MKPAQVEATLQLGKGGATPAWLEELREQVKKRRTVKVKMLRSAKGEASANVVASAIAERAGVPLVEVRGGTAVFGQPPVTTGREGRRRR